MTQKAWEVETEEQMLLALAGQTTREEFLQNRRERAAEVIERCEISPARRGFEIGSGDGTVANIVSPRCRSLDCADISASFLSEARRNCAECVNVSFHQIGSDYLSFLPSGQYDFGYSLHVFIHLNAYDIFYYLTDVKRLLRDGGIFMFDACALGPQTRDVFLQHALLFRSDPSTVRGLLNFNSVGALRLVAEEVGLKVSSSRSALDDSGWLKVLVTKSGH